MGAGGGAVDTGAKAGGRHLGVAGEVRALLPFAGYRLSQFS